MVRFIRKRDKGVCALCKLNCAQLSRGFKKLPLKDKKAIREKYGIPKHRTRFWDIDHIIPVAEGGGDSGPENLRTLCLPCHRTVTKELRARLSLAKKERQRKG